MNTLLSDIWPILLSAILPSVGLYIGYIHQLRMKMAVMEKTLEAQQKSLDNMQKRMDNHSKKQDDILDAIAQLKVEIVERFSGYEKDIAVISTEVKSINKTLNAARL